MRSYYVYTHWHCSVLVGQRYSLLSVCISPNCWTFNTSHCVWSAPLLSSCVRLYTCTYCCCVVEQQGVALQPSRVYRVWSVQMFLNSSMMKKPAADSSVCRYIFKIYFRFPTDQSLTVLEIRGKSGIIGEYCWWSWENGVYPSHCATAICFIVSVYDVLWMFKWMK